MSENYKYGLKISVLTEEDGGGFFVEVPDLPGCMADGDTLEEAIKNAKEAIESWIEAAKAEGRPIPEPTFYKDEEDYSGRLTVRIPKKLHKELVEIAQEQGVSLNQLILYALSKEVGRKETSVTIDIGV
ncbi:Predicted nuclease of the RNAse H fold, HicB family [Caldanaerovirga acetigignens]|uniref:Predicted nuclease of the RNAse H fold, HicB family n=1 Tax=Caldanaerovirga acetigignens TaxID=447595 RepID=A0A1M7IML7_9FIRM|nr:YlcI/YnfO family protein [Caldanaerovirga acetigignens]SHM41905.1 Predicted nuclease of the RNAse H fold, HicB family [Caldanaerovirga acetigignens]